MVSTLGTARICSDHRSTGRTPTWAIGQKGAETGSRLGGCGWRVIWPVFTQRTLGQAADVTVASVSLYERGGATPSSQTLAAFAGTPRRGHRLLLYVHPSTDAPAFFRSLRATRAIDRRRARHGSKSYMSWSRHWKPKSGSRIPTYPSIPCTKTKSDGRRKPPAARGTLGACPLAP